MSAAVRVGDIVTTTSGAVGYVTGRVGAEHVRICTKPGSYLTAAIGDCDNHRGDA